MTNFLATVNPLSVCHPYFVLCLQSAYQLTEAWVQSTLVHCCWCAGCLRPAAFSLLRLLHFDMVLGAAHLCALISLVLHEAV